LRPFQRAAEDDKTILVDGTMNANSATKPRMMPIKNLANNGPVGVLKPRCITRLARTFQSTRTRRRREQYMPLVAFCLRHFLADFIICMCEFDFRQAQASDGIRMKVSEKGALSVYGMGRFPVTLYKEQWLKLLDMSGEIRAFIAENEARLKAKD
jgi:hypothetical protein